jgi:hypothetical protein
MKTLIIHPNDKTTDFLKPIYSGIENKTVVTGDMTKDEVKDLITKHDRVIMLGHGTPFGLMAVGQFISNPVLIDKGENEYYSYQLNSGFIIDDSMVDELKNKECILIWCHADAYFHKHNLKGFSTSMFISEVSEAKYCGLPFTSQETVDESNNYFANEMGKISDKSIKEIYDNIKNSYGILAESNPVAHYNWSRFHINE